MKKVKKILILFTWVFIILYLIVSPFLIGNKIGNLVSNDLSINIKNDIEGNTFITSDEVKRILKKEGFNLLNMPFDSLSKATVEDRLLNYNFIKRADVFVSVNGRVEIDIVQPTPLMRVINNNGQNFYVDDEGYYMPVSKNYTAHVITITGNFPKPHKRTKADTLQIDDRISSIMELVNYINDDDLWNAQIEEIHVYKNGELELIPRVGGHRILFGTYEDYEAKFNKLYALYEQGFNKYGWNKYSKVNLAYKNQVVCTKI